MAQETTLPALLQRNAREMGDKAAIREKDHGIWRTYSWRQYHDEVRDFTLGLMALGCERGLKIGVIGDNRPRLYWAQVAAQCLGGAPVPVYQDSIASELAFVLNNAEVGVVVAEDQEQVDKILSIKGELPSLAFLIYDDPRGMVDYDEDFILSFAEVQEKGRAHGNGSADAFEQSVAAVQPDDIALMCYTSGTTGNPKGVMLSHANMLHTAETFRQNENVNADDDYLAYLPMAWVGDAVYGLGVSLLVGAVCNCPEGPETVQRDLRELGPTGLVAAPRIWENMLSQLQVRSADATPLKRWVFEHFSAAAKRAEQMRSEGKEIGAGLKLQLALGEFLVYGPIRDQLGLRRANWCYTGGAPLGPDTFRFFRGLGINLKQVYGSTEVSGLVSLQPDNQANPDTVGPPCPGIQVEIGENGEVLVKSDGVFKGYYKNDEATREAIDSDGWFHTGDAGIVDERGHLTIIDRAKDVGKLNDGTPFAPQFVENKLKFSPFISEAVSFGHEKPYVCAMIAIDASTVGNWAEKRALPYTNYMDLSQKSEVSQLITEEIAQINRSLPEVSRIRRFLLLAKDLDADDAEITRTRKLRRKFIAEKYEPVIDAFYGGGTEVDFKTQVTFEDGRQAELDTRLIILEAA